MTSLVYIFFTSVNTTYILHKCRLHRYLVSEFFYNTKYILNKGVEIHIIHKSTHPFSKWNIRGLTKRQSLLLVEEDE